LEELTGERKRSVDAECYLYSLVVRKVERRKQKQQSFKRNHL